jgi:hypothetical protein
MNIKIEFDDEGVVYELMDVVTHAHLKSTRDLLNKNTQLDFDVDGEHDAVLRSLDILIKYFGSKP